MGSIGHDDAMEILLQSCQLLPDYVKQKIYYGWHDVWHDEGEGFLNFYKYDASIKINDEMIPELLRCLDLLGDRVISLILFNNEITSKGAIQLFDAFRVGNTKINEIILTRNHIDNECIASLGEYIRSNKYISRISAGYNISDKEIEILSPFIEGNESLKHLNLSGNDQITDLSIPVLVKMVKTSHIEDIEILGTKITKPNALVVTLAQNQLQYGSNKLDLNEKSRQVSDEDLCKICEMMKIYGLDKLREINLGSNKFTMNGLSSLLDTLKECNATITDIDLSDNELDDEHMSLLGQYLQNDHCLQSLSLNDNHITDNGVEILSDFLFGNLTLRYLYLEGNEEITDSSVPYLADIAKNSCISQFNLDFTSTSWENDEEINKLLEVPIEQREIPIMSKTKSAAKRL